MKSIALFGPLLLAFSAFAGLEGEKRLFTMEKSYNPENIMIIHTQTDEDCRFVPSKKNTESNYVEFYWSMDNGKQTKEVHTTIRNEIKNRVAFQTINEDRDLFRIKLNDLKEVQHDLTDTIIEVTSEIEEGKCVVKSALALGPSSNYRKLEIKRTFCAVSKNAFGIPNGCHYLELDGVDSATQEKLSVRFRKK